MILGFGEGGKGHLVVVRQLCAASGSLGAPHFSSCELHEATLASLLQFPFSHLQEALHKQTNGGSMHEESLPQAHWTSQGISTKDAAVTFGLEWCSASACGHPVIAVKYIYSYCMQKDQRGPCCTTMMQAIVFCCALEGIHKPYQ